MSLSTPLNQLPSGNEHTQLVDDILTEFEAPPHKQSNISAEMQEYAFDSSQVPPPKLSGNFLQSGGTNKEGGGDGGGSGETESQVPFDYTESKLDWLIKMVKYPFVVFVIVFLLSLPQFNRFLFGLVPSCLLESGQVNIFGVLLKAVVGCVLFIIAQLLW